MEFTRSARFRLASVRFVLALSLVLGPLRGAGQAPVVGPVETALLLRQLDGEKRVLMIGAHPDDEDTSLLAALARGHGVRTAYLSLTRGEGGQNLVGSELGEALGILRTGELVAARALDGAEQFFTRAFDFGFSKSLEETLGHWPEEEVLRDVVWIVRSFRPHVIVSVFSGTPSDGHGHHHAAGLFARRAHEVAGDPAHFPDQLALGVEAWAPRKLYELRRGGGPSASFVVETGRLDPVLGRSFHQLAMEGRSLHSSQDMGVAQTPGPWGSGGALLDSRVMDSGESGDGLFAGIDTTLAGIARSARAPGEAPLLRALDEFREELQAAVSLLSVVEPGRSTAPLLAASELLRRAKALASEAPVGPGRTELSQVLGRRRFYTAHSPPRREWSRKCAWIETG
jgi:LmbE family N-acetylglucosaminyl deacetylase